MRQMRNMQTGQILDVKFCFMTVNQWEYFVTEVCKEDGVGWALVDGFEQEFGPFSKEEVNPYVLSAGPCEESLPARGWEWVDND